MFVNENRNNISMSFSSLIEDTKMKDILEKNYLPLIEKVDNDIYILTNNYMYSNVGSIHYKFFHFNKDGNLLTDPKYNYTRLEPDGYLMNFILRYPIKEEFSINYFVKLEDIRFFKSNYMDGKVLKESLSFNSISHNDIIKDPFKSELYNSREFFNKYLAYDLKQ